MKISPNYKAIILHNFPFFLRFSRCLERKALTLDLASGRGRVCIVRENCCKMRMQRGHCPWHCRGIQSDLNSQQHKNNFPSTQRYINSIME